MTDKPWNLSSLVTVTLFLVGIFPRYMSKTISLCYEDKISPDTNFAVFTKDLPTLRVWFKKWIFHTKRSPENATLISTYESSQMIKQYPAKVEVNLRWFSRFIYFHKAPYWNGPKFLPPWGYSHYHSHAFWILTVISLLRWKILKQTFFVWFIKQSN